MDEILTGRMRVLKLMRRDQQERIRVDLSELWETQHQAAESTLTCHQPTEVRLTVDS